MEFNKKGILGRAKAAQQSTAVTDEGLRAYMLKVYNYMATGILLTGIVALLTFKMSVVTDQSGFIVGLTQMGNAIYMSGLKWLVMLAPLGIVFYMSFGINKNERIKSSNHFLGFRGINGVIFVLNITCLHWNERYKSIFYLLSYFRGNEYLWLHN